MLGTSLERFFKPAHVPCSKNDALRLLRKLVIAKVLTEETYRQDNQYGGVLSYLAVNEAAARALTQGTLTIKMPFAVCSTSSVSMVCIKGLYDPCRCVSALQRGAVCMLSEDEQHALYTRREVLLASKTQVTPRLGLANMREALSGRLCHVYFGVS